ncbi:MAG: hypothetical protein ABR584_04665 [Candidatus Baltobacteraceae bacterium]
MVLEVLFVAVALMLLGALVGYWYRQRLTNEQPGYADLRAVSGYLAKTYGITLTEQDCENIVQAQAPHEPQEPMKMIGPPKP